MKFILGIVVGAALVGVLARAQTAPPQILYPCGPDVKCELATKALMSVSCERLSEDALGQIRQAARP